MGDWKLVALPAWELYDLETNRTELHDLASQQPERVATMAKVFEAWQKN